MIQICQLQPGIILRCCTDTRFKMNCLTVQLVRPLCRQEVAMNALLPSVLLRGSQEHPDIQSITRRLDELYGATVGPLVRSVGDYQTTGLYCGFTEDRFALGGDVILKPMLDFIRELMFRPRMEQGTFYPTYVESEKKNLISAIEAQINDKRSYTAAQLMKYMCARDPAGTPRLGEKEQAMAVTAGNLYAHYEKILRESRVELFYVGSQPIAQIAQLLMPMFQDTERAYIPLMPQTPFCDGGDTRREETMDVTQAKLAMGFVGPSTVNTENFVPMQVFNTLFGSGMTSKLFMNIREKQSLCYDIGSSYIGGKGILTVCAGMDCGQTDVVESAVLQELENCRRGEISLEELYSAQQALLSGLRSVHDSPSAMENYYATAALSGLQLTVPEYLEQVQQVSVEKAAEMANALRLHSVFTLKGASQ